MSQVHNQPIGLTETTWGDSMASDTFDDTVRSALKDLRDFLEDNPDASDSAVDEEIHDIADSATPVYNGTILEYAANNISLALSEPEIGPAFDGTPTPINIIAANIYEAIVNALHDEYRDWELRKEDNEDENSDEYKELRSTYKDAFNIAQSRGWNPDEHAVALSANDVDQISVTHPYNFLTEDEVEQISANVQ
jgi:hypothetical protein